ncbi:hypothetical protein HDU89_006304 [Geranomyces variabilis]|nr:hypothetical protein HDU89_006304 [Geranomyces variabilis]
MTTPKHQEILRGFRDMRLKTAELDVEYEERGRKRVVVTLADAIIRYYRFRRPNDDTEARGNPARLPRHEAKDGRPRHRVRGARAKASCRHLGRHCQEAPTAIKFRKVLEQAYKPDLVRLEYPLGDPPASDVATAAATQKAQGAQPGAACPLRQHYGAISRSGNEARSGARAKTSWRNLADAVRKPTAMKFRQVLKQAYKPDLVRPEYPLGDPPESDVATAAAIVEEPREKHIRTKDEKRFGKKVDLYVPRKHVQEDEYAVGENSGAETKQHLRHAKANVIHLAKCARSLSMALKKRVPDCREVIVPFFQVFDLKDRFYLQFEAPDEIYIMHQERNLGLYVQYDNIMAQFHAAETKRAAEREAMRASSSKAPPAPFLLPAEHSREQSPSSPSAPAPVLVPAEPSAPVLLPAEHSREQSPSSPPAPAAILLPAEPSAPVVLPAKPSAPVLPAEPSAPVHLPAKPSAPVHLPAEHSREQSPSSSRRFRSPCNGSKARRDTPRACRSGSRAEAESRNRGRSSIPLRTSWLRKLFAG